MKTVTVGVIGCGRIANGAHLPPLSKMEGVNLKYVCDIIKEKSDVAKEKYGAQYSVYDYKEILADPEVDCVFVLTPNYAHYTVTMDALRAGKHVFCEKPITVDYDKSVEMAEEARKQNKLLNIGVCNRYHKSVEMLEKMNKEGAFGKIYHVYCSFRKYRCIPGLGGPFTDKAQSGGGVLIDWGVHFLDLILYVLGGAKLENLTCDAYNEIAKDMKTYKHKSEMWASETSDIENGTNDVDDFISGYVRTDKASISFNGAWAQNLEKNEMFVDFLGDKGGARLSYGKQFTFFDGETLETTESDHEIPNMFRKEDIAFLESCENGIKTKSNIANVLETAKLLDYLYRSADIRKEVQC